MKNQDMENNLENFKKELDADPFYKEYPEIKDKMIEGYTEMMFGEKKADGGIMRVGLKSGSYDYDSFEHKINELNAHFKRYKKKGGTLTFKQFAPLFAAENFATGGRAGFANGTEAPSITLGPKEEPMGPRFETNDPGEAAKEIIKRLIRVEGAQIPLTREGLLSLNIDSLDKQSLGGIIDLLGGELEFGVGRDKEGKGAGFTFRKQFKDGSGMTRRTFLKLLGGMAAVPIVGKFFKLAKVGKTMKEVPVIKTDDVAGKPEWFDALVNKVITEGDDVTKKFATGERQSIHQKTLDDGSVVRVTEDIDDGAVRVEYDSPTNTFEDTVQMEYKKPLPDEGAPSPKAEFTTSESGPVGRRYGPDDYEIEVDEVGGSSIRDLDSDVSKLKEYATGEKPTMKELVQNIERKKKAKRITEDPEAQSDAVIARQGEALDYDDYASGGIARMLGE